MTSSSTPMKHRTSRTSYETKFRISTIFSGLSAVTSYWEKHCYDIPVCFALRSVFDSLDGVDALADNLKKVVADIDQVDVLMPQVLAQFPETLAIMRDIADHAAYHVCHHVRGPSEHGRR